VTGVPKLPALWHSWPMDTKHHRLLSAARRLLRSSADAEDAVQDTYVRALTAFRNAVDPTAAWLHTVLRNIAIDRLRRKQLESEHAEIESLRESSLEFLLEARSECEAALRHLLQRVRSDEAAAILLIDVFEFDYDDIGRVLGKSEDASRQYLHRARTRARRPGSVGDCEEEFVALCWRAIEGRDPSLLMHMLPVITARAQLSVISVDHRRDGRSYSKLVQVNGRYAIALVLDGVVLCNVPVGAQTTLMSELA
jgi:RNA polymerase sigma factor (sigma-70 family)